MTRQEMFDKIARHLLTQKEKSVSEVGACQYRGLDGAKCAIGALIPDEVYDPAMEGESASAVVYRPAVCKALLGLDAPPPGPPPGEFSSSQELRTFRRTQDFLDELQAIHDQRDPDFWRSALHNFADQYKLDPTVLDEFPRS